MRFKLKLLLILLVGLVFIFGSGPALAESVFAWTLTIKLTDKPFYDDKAWVEVRGPDGYTKSSWYDWSSIKSGASTGQVSLNMPESSFPSGEPYEVCASSGDLRPYVDPN